MLPDVPWILQRAIRGFGLGVDPYDVRLYAAVQAALGPTLLLCAALAMATRHAKPVFAVLSVNAALHLLLDATERKWADGVHLIAPLDWHGVSFGWYWPEAPFALALTALGGAYAFMVLWRHPVPPPPPAPARQRRWGAAAALLLAYLTVPFALGPAAERHDVQFVRTLRDREARRGRLIELDRDRYVRGSEGDRLVTFAGEQLWVTTPRRPRSGTVSVRGVFTSPDTIAVEALREHLRWVRDAPSYLALVLLAVIWVAGWVRGRPPRRPGKVTHV